jgi:hypothetical protein
MKNVNVLCGGALALGLAATASHAEPTVELMVQEAAGLLHHSCDSLVEVTGADEEAIVSVVRKMVAVSFINRQIDFSEYAKTDAEKDALRAAFVEELRAGCDADRNALVVGLVDNAVKKLLGL